MHALPLNSHYHVLIFLTIDGRRLTVMLKPDTAKFPFFTADKRREIRQEIVIPAQTNQFPTRCEMGRISCDKSSSHSTEENITPSRMAHIICVRRLPAIVRDDINEG